MRVNFKAALLEFNNVFVCVCYISNSFKLRVVKVLKTNSLLNGKSPLVYKKTKGGMKMSRYTGPTYKKSRHLGFSLLETGKELAKRPYGPGQHGNDRRRGKAYEYKLQLMEKQKVRLMYGVNEKQFRLTFEKAAKMKGIQGENFLKLLESRLDNIVYRMGLGSTRKAARQIVNHGTHYRKW